MGMLRENMTRLQVEEILRPSKVGVGVVIGGLEHGFYWLSSDSGVYLDYIRKNGGRERRSSPAGTFVTPIQSLELSVMDQKSGEWTTILVPSK